ncbi:MAG: hypothetical protein QOH12_1862 [Solirubrobacteraceae bacterium]|nr:hypothetical protein [Solirubrobacteraceae bacterium]
MGTEKVVLDQRDRLVVCPVAATAAWRTTPTSPERMTKRLVAQLEALGHHVTLEDLAA